MTTLRELQSQMHAVLRGTKSVADVARAVGVNEKRLGIYRGFVRGHVRNSLGKIYPITRQLVGRERWDTLYEGFFASCPPTSWELNTSVEPFYGYLDAQITAGAIPVSPFLASFAQYEWEEFATYIHPAAVPSPETLVAAIVNPTVTVLQFDYPVVPFVVAHPEADDVGPETLLPDRLETPQMALLFRRAETYGVAYHVATPALLFAVRVTMEGMSVEEAATQSGQPIDAIEAAMERAIAIGLILSPS
jgi:hypothetical protein